MTTNMMEDYKQLALKTEIDDYTIVQRRTTPELMRELHAAMIIVTEAAELMDAYKKAMIYGKEKDTTNIEEEMGDLMWGLTVLADQLNIPFQRILDKNIAKLKVRYGDKFSEEKALNRDLDKERISLETL